MFNCRPRPCDRFYTDINSVNNTTDRVVFQAMRKVGINRLDTNIDISEYERVERLVWGSIPSNKYIIHDDGRCSVLIHE